MDPITHALTGAAIQQVGLRQKIGRDALLAGAIAGGIVDLDIFIPVTLKFLDLGSPMDMFIYHRGMTHSFVLAPVVALICSVIWLSLRKLWTRRRLKKGKPALSNVPYWLLFISCLLPVLFHILLDACTSYGTQLFWPFLPDRVAWDSIAIIDVFFTSIAGIVLLACFIVGKLIKNSTRALRATRTIGIIGMILMVGYLSMGRVLHNNAINSAAEICANKAIINPTASAAAENTQAFIDHYKKQGAYPVLGTPFLWRVIFEDNKEWVICAVNLLQPHQAKTTRVQKENSYYIDLARNSMQLATFDWFSNKMLRAEVTRDGRLTLVDFHDMRYGWPVHGKNSLWAFRFVYNPSGELLATGQVRSASSDQLRKQILNKVLGKK